MTLLVKRALVEKWESAGDEGGKEARSNGGKDGTLDVEQFNDSMLNTDFVAVSL